MTRIRATIWASLIAASCAGVSPALAAVNSSASISSVQFTLVDLDPSDGVTPSFSFSADSGETGYGFYLHDASSSVEKVLDEVSPGSFSVFDQAASSSVGVVHGSVLVNGTSLTASGTASGAGSFIASVRTGDSILNPSGNITLSPGSALIIGVTYSLSASASNPQVDSCVPGGFCPYEESASAHIRSDLTYAYQTNNDFVNHSDGYWNELSATVSAQTIDHVGVYRPDTGTYDIVESPIAAVSSDMKSTTGSFLSVFSNTSSSPQIASLIIGAGVNGQGGGVVQAVPEPSSFALMGLGVVGLAFARRSGGQLRTNFPSGPSLCGFCG